ncbi:CBS domain-containing protein [Limimaricola hongkongensis]
MRRRLRHVFQALRAPLCAMKPLPDIARIMTREVITVTPGTDLLRAMQLMALHGISGLPVIDAEDRLVGMLSQRDCLKAALHASYHDAQPGRAAEAMHAPVESLPADLDILSAIEKFLDSRYRRFPVLEEGRIIGILTRGDLVRALAELGGLSDP